MLTNYLGKLSQGRIRPTMTERNNKAKTRWNTVESCLLRVPSQPQSLLDTPLNEKFLTIQENIYISSILMKGKLKPQDKIDPRWDH